MRQKMRVLDTEVYRVDYEVYSFVDNVLLELTVEEIYQELNRIEKSLK